MSLLDWLIIIAPVIFVVSMGIYSRRYVRGVADFLSAGRLCGRYVICVADVANALSIMGLIAYVEVHYKTGFALAFWNYLTIPVTVFMGLTGFCFYRFRETKAMSLGQFLEMRYNRPFLVPSAAACFVVHLWQRVSSMEPSARAVVHSLPGTTDHAHSVLMPLRKVPSSMDWPSRNI